MAVTREDALQAWLLARGYPPSVASVVWLRVSDDTVKKWCGIAAKAAALTDAMLGYMRPK